MEYSDRTCIIVIDIQMMSVGFIVDYVSEVLVIPEENIVPPPKNKTGFSTGTSRESAKSEMM